MLLQVLYNIFSHPEFLEKLLDYNSKLDPEDKDSCKRQFDITKRDSNYHFSPMEYAILFGNLKCIELLIKYKSPLTMLMANDQTVFYLFYRVLLFVI